MQALLVKKDNAIKAFNNADTNGKKLLTDLFGNELQPEKITDRIKTFEDALALYPASDTLKAVLNFSGFDKVLNGAKAMAQLQIIAAALNEGWQPDWTDSSQYKYYPWFKKAGSGLSFHAAVYWAASTAVGSRLCFKSRELAEYAATQFKDIYAEFMAL
jgi:hypothetical protein